MRCSRAAFTLIEILIASTLVIFLLSLVTGTMLHINRITTRTTALLAMHDAVGSFQRTAQERLQAVHHGGAWHCLASTGSDGTWNTGDETVSLTWLATTPDRMDAGQGLYWGDQDDLTWFRLIWRGPKHASSPGIFLSRSSGKRKNTSFAWCQYVDPNANVRYVFDVWTAPRRDRRRDLNDNDWRFVQGVTAAIYNNSLQAGGLVGDGRALDMQETPCFSPDLELSEFTLSWVDRGGWTTTFSPANGLSRRDSAGASQPTLGTAWNSQTQISLDGVFLDGRPHTLLTDTRDIRTARPILVRMGFLMRREQPPGAPRTRDDLTQRFSISIPVSAGHPAP